MNQEDVVTPAAPGNPEEEPAAATELPEITDQAGAEPPASELAAQLAEANRTAEENWEKFVRTQAELENLKRRAEKDVQNAHKFALERFARELLTVIDSLELGLQAAVGDNPDVEKLREGMELTLKQFQSVLEKFNVVEVDPVGEKFNPELHQAMAMQPSEDAAPNTVLKVFQKGYLLNDRLLRPSMVVVAQGN
jgi:molecular chaperone GrpE